MPRADQSVKEQGREGGTTQILSMTVLEFTPLATITTENVMLTNHHGCSFPTLCHMTTDTTIEMYITESSLVASVKHNPPVTQLLSESAYAYCRSP